MIEAENSCPRHHTPPAINAANAAKAALIRKNLDRIGAFRGGLIGTEENRFQPVFTGVTHNCTVLPSTLLSLSLIGNINVGRLTAGCV
jgi:hypothetical protein